MNRISAALALSLFATAGLVQDAAAQSGPYKVLATTKVGGAGGFDYVTADSVGRKLYVARSGPAGHVAAFDGSGANSDRGPDGRGGARLLTLTQPALHSRSKAQLGL
jgi:hypothetical protein